MDSNASKESNASKDSNASKESNASNENCGGYACRVPMHNKLLQKERFHIHKDLYESHYYANFVNIGGRA